MSSVAVLACATMLSAFGYPHRRLLRHSHGSKRLPVFPIPSHGCELGRFARTGTHWKPVQVRNTVLESSARWLVWSEDEDPGSVDDLLTLFDDDRTFAVSRQCHYRGWKDTLLPMAPFRNLQPGEASQVLAPLSRTIVVDREKLAALGIPNCGLSGTAWLWLFWKAAAAGWRSYSMGQNTVSTEQPDFPSQETAFLMHFLSRPELRQIGPCEPSLGRGNAAFCPTAQTEAHFHTDRPRVLLVSPYLPFPLSHGGAVRIYNLCRALRSRVDFLLVALREEHEQVPYEQLQQIFRTVHAVDMDELPSGGDHLPKQVRHHQSRSLSAVIRDLSQRYRPDLIQIEYTHLAAYREADPGVPAILVEHDLTFRLYEQLAKAGSSDRREYERWLSFERRQFCNFDAVWTVSEADRWAAIAEGSNRDRTFTVPNGVDVSRFTPDEDLADPPEILFVGSFRHLPNLLGFEQLCGQVMPRVWRRFPNARVRVVAGPQHEKFWRAFGRSILPEGLDSRIRVQGYVEDLRPLYARASVVVVPLDVSAGTNIKVLEAMACGKAVVTTAVGCAGLGLRDKKDALISTGWDQFNESVCDLLSNPALRSFIASEARKTAERRFSWERIADSAFQSYTTLLAEGAPVAQASLPVSGSRN